MEGPLRPPRHFPTLQVVLSPSRAANIRVRGENSLTLHRLVELLGSFDSADAFARECIGSARDDIDQDEIEDEVPSHRYHISFADGGRRVASDRSGAISH